MRARDWELFSFNKGYKKVGPLVFEDVEFIHDSLFGIENGEIAKEHYYTEFKFVKEGKGEKCCLCGKENNIYLFDNSGHDYDEIEICEECILPALKFAKEVAEVRKKMLKEEED